MGNKQLEINARNEVERNITTAVETELQKLPEYHAYKKAQATPVDNSIMRVVSLDGKTHTFNNDDMSKYIAYRMDLSSKLSGATSLQDVSEADLQKKYGFTDKDKLSALDKAVKQEGSTAGARYEALRTKNRNIADSYGGIVKRRAELEDNETRKYEAVMNPRQRILNYEDAKQRQTITDILNVVTSDLLKSGQKNFGGIDIEKVKLALNDDERKNTSFSYSQKDGQPTLTISNLKHTGGESVDLPINQDLAVSMGLYETDKLETAKNIMVLRQGKTGTNIYEALPLPVTAGLLEKNTVKYELKNLNNGTYKLSLYTKGNDVPYVGDRGYTEAEINQILFGGRITDASVEAYHKGAATSPFTAAPVSTGVQGYPGMNTPITNYFTNPNAPLPAANAPQNQ